MKRARSLFFLRRMKRTVSYGGGTAKGPEAIINASQYVEFLDDEFFRELCFEEGIATLPPLVLRQAYREVHARLSAASRLERNRA